MKNILVPVDFSPSSRHAFQYAAQFAQRYKAKITLFHAYTPALIEPHMAVYMQEALKNQEEKTALSYFAQLEEEITPAMRSGIAFDYKIALGSSVDAIINIANEVSADLIIMGMRGGNILGKKILGSTTKSVIHIADQPVLVIPEGVNFNAYKHIAYATYFNQDDMKVLDKILNFAKDYDATVHCIHIRKNSQLGDIFGAAILQKAYQFDISGDKLSFDTIENENVAKGLMFYTQNRAIDLIVMLTHRRSLLEQIFQKSTTKEMLDITQVPLLVLNESIIHEKQQIA